MIYPGDQKYNFIKKNPFFSFQYERELAWNTLPTTIWVYEAEGIAKSSLFNQLCFHRLNGLVDDQFQVT